MQRTQSFQVRLRKMKSLSWRTVPLDSGRPLTSGWRHTAWNLGLCKQVTSLWQILPPSLLDNLHNPCLAIFVASPLSKILCCLLFTPPAADHLNSLIFSLSGRKPSVSAQASWQAPSPPTCFLSQALHGLNKLFSLNVLLVSLWSGWRRPHQTHGLLCSLYDTSQENYIVMSA